MRLVKALVGGVIGAAIGAAIMVGLGVYVLFDVPAWPAIIIGLLTGLGVRLMGKSDRPGPSYLCGAIAAALTLVAYFAGADTATKVMQAQVAKNASKPATDLLNSEMQSAPPVTAEQDDPAAIPDEEPATGDEPAAETPAIDEPTSDEPTTDEPATDEPSVDEGAAADEEPAASNPAVEEVVVDEEVEVTEPAKPINVPRAMGDGKRPVRGQEFSILSFVLIGVGALIAYELGRSSGG